MTGVIYARYSSDNQREESIEGQLRECKQFAKQNGIDIVNTYIDRALSAKTDNRPDFQRMIKESAGRAFEIVIVWKLDRFARNRYDSAHYKSVLRKNGVKVMSATETISEGAEGILLESMLEGMAEYYSAELAEKVTRGMTENALKCKYNGGTVPIGYVIDNEQHYQIDPLTAPAVLEAFKMYANGSSIQEVANEMKRKGIHTTRGGTVNINSVTRMFHNRKYIGEYKYRDIVQSNGVPAIVPTELFNKAQERMATNKKAPARHKAEDEYLLTTKLFCGNCKHMITGESGTSHTMLVHRYYKCFGVRQHNGCNKKTVKKDWKEEQIITQIKILLNDESVLEKIADEAIEILGRDSSALPILRKQYSETEKSIANILNAMEQGIITPSTKQRLEELESRKSDLYAEITKEEMSKPTLTKEQILCWFDRFKKLDTKKLEHRRRLIDTFINSVFLWDDKMLITFNYKNGTKTVTFSEIESSDLGSYITANAAPFRVFITDFSNEHSIFLCVSRLFGFYFGSCI